MTSNEVKEMIANATLLFVTEPTVPSAVGEVVDVVVLVALLSVIVRPVPLHR